VIYFCCSSKSSHLLGSTNTIRHTQHLSNLGSAYHIVVRDLSFSVWSSLTDLSGFGVREICLEGDHVHPSER
jgi:hypothetical protein